MAIKIIIVLAGCWVIYVKLIKNQDITEMWNSMKLSFSSPKNVFLMIFALLLMPVNMAFEAIKWQKSVLPVEKVPFKKAFVAIFTGVTTGMLFPNRTGDFLGRIFILESGNRIKAAMLTFVGNIAQMLVTVTLGGLSCFFFLKWSAYWYIMLILLIIITLGFLFYFNIRVVIYFKKLIPEKWRPRIEKYIDIFDSYTTKDLARILLLALAKYIV